MQLLKEDMVLKNLIYFTKRLKSFAGRKLYFNLISMVIISLFEGVGIFLLIPLINLSGILNVNPDTQTSIHWLSNFFNSIPETISLLIILSIYILIVVLQSYFQRKQSILNTTIQQGFIRHLREETYKSMLQANWGFFLNKRKSDIINLMTNEINHVSAGTNLFLLFLTSLVFTLIQLGIALWLSSKMTLFVLFFGLTIIFFSRKLITRFSDLGRETYKLSQAYIAGITDQFNGIKDIKSNLLEESHLKWFRGLNKRMEDNRIKLSILNSNSQFIYKIALAFLIAIFVFFSIKMFKAQSTELMLIIVIFSRLWPRFSNIQSNLEQLSAILPSFKALVELNNQCSSAKEFSEKELKDLKPFLLKNGIECRGVNFRYTQSEKVYALKDINFKVHANQLTAIVGRSGAGKSTLIDLLMGLNQPESGKVLIDGIKLNSANLLALRRSISYVPQDPFLFNTTIKENLKIIDEFATDEQIWNALEFAAAAEFVKKLPYGLDTVIGDRGIKLSGGERQRLVLARAILRKPSILILDEATSALDTENESKIQEAIEILKGKMTIIVIAHRLSTIKNADQVIVLDQGEIIQQGQFDQLADEKRGMFSHLLKKQMEVSV